uniref:response regulator n=1 Tax=Brevundimonas sp. TaxID=1871086 RepID=UPI0025DE9383
MPTIDALSERSEPVRPETPCSEVFDRFDREPDCLLLAVVEDGRPVGVVERDPFLRKLAAENGRTLYGSRPVSALMDNEPVVVEGSVKVSTLGQALLSQRASNVLRGFIITHEGRYAGVGSLVRLLQANALEDRDGEADRAAAAAREAEFTDQIRAAARSKSTFLSVLNRELRTPMNGVLAVAELLQRQPIGPDAKAYVQTIVDSSETTMRILEDALDLARAEAGELTLNPKPVLLRQLMDDIETLWAPRAAQDGVSLMVGYEGDTELAAEVDGLRLRQVFNHLIGNALKYARNGVVEASLKAAVQGEGLIIEARVRDNGQGIEAERIEHLFDVAARHEDAKAGGLGLPICRLLMQTMGGSIRAESNAGHGATFIFGLSAPRAYIETEEAVASNVAELTDLNLTAQPHILIVDDNATNRVVAQALCEMFGCTSAHAEDGLEALEAVKGGRFDLILMDIKMPRMDGVEATRAIRALDGPVSQTPIVALTANADPDDAKRYLEIGMAAVVEKPIKPERLRAAINTALSGAEAEAP